MDVIAEKTDGMAGFPSLPPLLPLPPRGHDTSTQKKLFAGAATSPST